MSISAIAISALYILSTSTASANNIQGLSCIETGEYLESISEYPATNGSTQQYSCNDNCYASNAMSSNPAYGGSPQQNTWFAATSSICTSALWMGIPVGSIFTLTRQPLLQSYYAGPTETYYPVNTQSYTYTPLPLNDVSGCSSSYGLTTSGSTYPGSASTPSPSSVKGDPAFIGFLGQEFQVHGVDKYVYNIVSTNTLQFNTRFIYMGKGRTTLKSLPSLPALYTKPWTHEGNYMGEVGIQLGSVDQLYLNPGVWEKGWKQVNLNGKHILSEVGKQYSVSDDGSYVFIKSTHEILVHTKQFDLVLVNADNFFNIEATLNLAVDKVNPNLVDGLLGHTAHTRTAKRFPVHDLDDYSVEHTTNDLWSNEFNMNKFQLKQTAAKQ